MVRKRCISCLKKEVRPPPPPRHTLPPPPPMQPPARVFYAAAGPAPNPRDRMAMLHRVRQDWIEGVLKRSLNRIARIDLCLEVQPDAVEQSSSAVALEL